jgi:non-specific protein-tyrosine kinase
MNYSSPLPLAGENAAHMTRGHPMKLNLGKAVEKARKNKHRIPKVYPLSDRSAGKAKSVGKEATAESKRLTAKSAGSQWEAPEYSKTRRIDIDKDTTRENRCVSLMTDTADSGLYDVLRAQVQFAAGEYDLRTIMVTSAEPGDGKTLTCINLACSFAKSHHQTVLLVDADLKKQQVHRYLGINSQHGLIDYLRGDRSIEQCLVWPGIDKIVLLSGGETLQESSELASSPMMNAFIQDVRNRYEDRFVFLDTPPVLAGADTMAMAKLVDGIIVVTQTGKTSKENFLKSVDLLPREKIIGVVMNRETVAKSKYYYNYYR